MSGEAGSTDPAFFLEFAIDKIILISYIFLQPEKQRGAAGRFRVRDAIRESHPSKEIFRMHRHKL